jgi:pimeloyl-ACP methyl ester carboxylesterase
LVSWDLRGTAPSNPASCFADNDERGEFWQGIAIPLTRDEERAYVAKTAEMARRCGERNGDLLAHLSAADSARDLDYLQRVLAERTITFVGESVGTLIGQTYANLYPTRVRAMALDGVEDPVAYTTGTAELLASTLVSVDQEFDEFIITTLEEARRLGRLGQDALNASLDELARANDRLRQLGGADPTDVEVIIARGEVERLEQAAADARRKIRVARDMLERAAAQCASNLAATINDPLRDHGGALAQGKRAARDVGDIIADHPVLGAFGLPFAGLGVASGETGRDGLEVASDVLNVAGAAAGVVEPPAGDPGRRSDRRRTRRRRAGRRRRAVRPRPQGRGRPHVGRRRHRHPRHRRRDQARTSGREATRSLGRRRPRRRHRLAGLPDVPHRVARCAVGPGGPRQGVAGDGASGHQGRPRSDRRRRPRHRGRPGCLEPDPQLAAGGLHATAGRSGWTVDGSGSDEMRHGGTDGHPHHRNAHGVHDDRAAGMAPVAPATG